MSAYFTLKRVYEQSHGEWLDLARYDFERIVIVRLDSNYSDFFNGTQTLLALEGLLRRAREAGRI